MGVYGIIYLLIDGTNDFEYVGQTTQTFEARFYQHVHGDLYVDRVIRKHGVDLFTTAILKEGNNQEELDYWEKHFIKSRDTMKPNGYNMIEGGIGTTGKNNPFLGKHHTAETKAIIATKNRGNSPFKNLLKELDKRQLSYISLAEILNLKQQNVSNKMIGKYNFLAKEVAKLVEFFGLPVEYLMARDDKEEFSISKRHVTPFKNLIYEMDKRNLSYTSLAKLLGSSHSFVSMKMYDKRNFTVEDIKKLVEFFDKPAEYLMARDDGLPAMQSEEEKRYNLSIAIRQNSPFKNLIHEMDKRQLSYKRLTELMGFAVVASISSKMRGETRFTEKDVAKLVEIFDKPAEYLMARDE